MKSVVEIQGTILRKKKRQQWLVLAVKQQPDGGATVAAYLSRKAVVDDDGLALCCTSECQDFLFLHATVLLKGFLGPNASRPLLHQYHHPHVTEEEDACTISGQDETQRLYVNHISLVQCAPDPSAVLIVLKSLAANDGRFPPSVLPNLMPSSSSSSTATESESSSSSSNSSAWWAEEANRILSLKQRPRRLAIARLVRGLQGMEYLDREPRKRLPHIRLYELEMLREIEMLGRTTDCEGWLSWTLLEPKKFVGKMSGAEQTAQRLLPLNLPVAGPIASSDLATDPSNALLSSRGNRTRAEYLTTKKHPQIQWMTDRVRRLLTNNNRDTVAPVPHILDVGGGRGDLAAALALTMPNCWVTVVDRNRSSLEAGRAYAKQLGLSKRMYFVHADFRAFTKDPDSFYDDAVNSSPGCERRSPPPPINLVAALHACGDLSDLALSFAQQLSCSFVVCPCCYSKRYIVDGFQPVWWEHLSRHPVATSDQKNKSDRSETACILGRLAELNERPDVSRRAMTIINSMRLRSFAVSTDGLYCVSLEEYENVSSLRNAVLVGAT